MKYEGESSENLKYILSRNLLSTKCTTDIYKKYIIVYCKLEVVGIEEIGGWVK